MNSIKIWLLSLMACWALSTHAANLEAAYIVGPLEVASADQAPSENRDVALEEGTLKAFEILCHRVVPQQAWGQVPKITADQIRRLQTSHRILTEKTSPQRYSAEIQVHFNPRAVQKFFATHQIPYTEKPMAERLVVPVLVNAGTVHLWDDAEWALAWRTGTRGIPTILLPLNDLSDGEILPATTFEAALARQTEIAPFVATHIQPLKERYHADDVVFALADVQAGQLRLALWRPETETVVALEPVSLEGVGEEVAAAEPSILQVFFNKAVKQMQQAMDLQLPPVVEGDLPLASPERRVLPPVQTLRITFPVRGTSQIAGLQRSLSAVTGVSDVHATHLRPGQVTFSLQSSLSEAEIRKMLTVIQREGA